MVLVGDERAGDRLAWLSIVTSLVVAWLELARLGEAVGAPALMRTAPNSWTGASVTTAATLIRSAR